MKYVTGTRSKYKRLTLCVIYRVYFKHIKVILVTVSVYGTAFVIGIPCKNRELVQP